MGFVPTQVIWQAGEYKPWHDATVHVMAHGLHYGSAVFEGVRAYETREGPVVFRNRDHVRRLFASAALYGIAVPHEPDEIEDVCRQVVVRNGLKSAYIRPIVYRTAGTFGLVAGDDSPAEVAVAAIEWGRYLGEEGIKHGIDACVSSWRRLSSDAVPAAAKAAGHYLNAQLIAGEAKRHGYAEGIALDARGLLAEGAGENLFVVRGSRLFTTPLDASILSGITRDTALTLAAHLGIDAGERHMTRDFLCTADEVFLTGTAAEITPVRSIDRMPIGTGSPGPVTRSVQSAFFGLFSGETEDRWGWLDRVDTTQESS